MTKSKLEQAHDFMDLQRRDPSASEWEAMYAATLYQVALLERLVELAERQNNKAIPTQVTVTQGGTSYGFWAGNS